MGGNTGEIQVGSERELYQYFIIKKEQKRSHLSVLTFFPDWGILRRSRCVVIFL